jgi:hypothetical protein
VLVPIASLDGTEGTVAITDLTFTNADWFTPQTVTVTGVNDSITDGDVLYTIRVGDPSSGTDPAYDALLDGDTADVAVTNLDNEPEVSIAVTDNAATEAAGDTGAFTMTRTGSTAAALTVNYSISGSATNGTDYGTLSGTASIPAGQLSATVTTRPASRW